MRPDNIYICSLSLLSVFVPNNSSPSSQPSQSSQPTGSPSQSSQPTKSTVIDDPPETTDAPTSTPSSQSTSDCVGRVNVCFALDMSGSVCSPDFSNPQQCFGCTGECNEDPFDLATCCSNFKSRCSNRRMPSDTECVY